MSKNSSLIFIIIHIVHFFENGQYFLDLRPTVYKGKPVCKTSCPRGLGQILIETYLIKWGKTSCTDSTKAFARARENGSGSSLMYSFVLMLDGN